MNEKATFCEFFWILSSRMNVTPSDGCFLPSRRTQSSFKEIKDRPIISFDYIDMDVEDEMEKGAL